MFYVSRHSSDQLVAPSPDLSSFRHRSRIIVADGNGNRRLLVGGTGTRRQSGSSECRSCRRRCPGRRSSHAGRCHAGRCRRCSGWCSDDESCCRRGSTWRDSDSTSGSGWISWRCKCSCRRGRSSNSTSRGRRIPDAVRWSAGCSGRCSGCGRCSSRCGGCGTRCCGCSARCWSGTGWRIRGCGGCRLNSSNSTIAGWHGGVLGRVHRDPSSKG